MTKRNLVLSIGVGAAASLACMVGVAHAQEAVEGKGVEVSPGTVLHPNFGAEFGVINNLFYESDSVVTTTLMRLTANFAVASEKIEPNEQVPGEDAGNEAAPQTYQFRASGGARYEEFFYYDNPSTAAQRNLAFDVQAHLQVYPERTWSFIADDRLRRDVQPRNFEDASSSVQDDNLLNLGLRYQPGGRTISATLRYQNELDVIEATTVDNRMNHQLGLRGDWQWLPYTRFFSDLSLGFYGPIGATQALPKESSMPIRGLVGIATTLTEPITVKAHVGWAYGPYGAGEGYNGPLADVEFGYAYAPTGRITLEYNYDYEDSLNANYFRDHKLLAKVDQQIGEKLLLSGSVDLRLRGYRGVPMVLGGGPSRDDLVVAGTARAQYVLTERYYLTATYVGTSDQTSYRYMTGSGTDDPSFNRHEVMLGARAAF